MSQTFNIAWPEKRAITADTIQVWYEDAVANGECDPGMETPADMAAELHVQGLITLCRS